MVIKVSGLAQKKACGDSSHPLKSLCTVRQQSVSDTLLLGFQKYLYAHLCFDFMFVSFGSHCSFLPVFILIHGPLFQSVQIFFLFLFFLVAAVYIVLIVQTVMGFSEAI